MKLNELLDIEYSDIKKLNEADARKMLTYVRRNVTARKNALEKAGLDSPALKGFNKRREGREGKEDKGLSAIKSEIQSGIIFLKGKTSTVKGAISREEKISRILGEHIDRPLTKDERGLLWAAYDSYTQNTSREQQRDIHGGSDKVIRAIADIIRREGALSTDEILTRLETVLDEKGGGLIGADTTSEMVRLARDEE